MTLLDLERLSSWLDAQGLSAGQPTAAQPLPGGTSNVMFVVERGLSRWVLRRPAQVAVQRANQGMSREFHLLSALRGTGVPHPEAVALCEDKAVLGCTFYLARLVEGVHPMPPPPALNTPRHKSEIGYALVDALAQLHQVDWQRAGLGDFGRPDQFHERQVDRWTTQLASYRGRQLPGINDVARWLESNRPTSFTPTIMHGDYHSLNVLIADDAPGRVVAILDWETATIGDPLLDLAGFCEIWRVTPDDGWPDRSELIEHYRAVRRLQGDADLSYYQVLYNFRLAVLQEGIYQRSLEDPTRPDRPEAGDRALANVARAVDLVSSCRP